MSEVPTPKFRRWCRRARKLWPTERPVRVRRHVNKGYVGTCWDMGSYWLIEVDPGLDTQSQLDTLMHEWCHALRGEEGGLWDLHSDEFWMLLGSMYRAWHRVD